MPNLRKKSRFSSDSGTDYSEKVMELHPEALARFKERREEEERERQREKEERKQDEERISQSSFSLDMDFSPLPYRPSSHRSYCDDWNPPPVRVGLWHPPPTERAPLVVSGSSVRNETRRESFVGRREYSVCSNICSFFTCGISRCIEDYRSKNDFVPFPFN